MSLVKNLYREFNDFRLEIPEMEFLDEGVTVLIGRSGSGKSTVVRVLLGLEPCPGLQWKFQGEDIAQLPPPDRRIGVIFQRYELFPHMTAEENLRFAARARRIPPAEIGPRIKNFVTVLELGDCARRPARVLSGGEQQRVALARALIGNPRFLILDEPFSALDADLRNSARNLVGHVIKEEKVPTLLITHDMEDVKQLASRVLRLENGKLANS